jgi:UDP-glucuronate decarboxylase
VVSNFIVQALLGRDITVYREGTQTRAFCYVDDLIDGLVRLMSSGDDLIGPINIGNPQEFTMLQLANTVIDLTGSRSQVLHLPLRQDDPRQRRPDISTARKTLGWEPLHVVRRQSLISRPCSSYSPEGDATKRRKAS